MPAVNQLEPGAVSLTPFEAVSGNRHEDVVVPPWRYIQFEYSMRLLSEGFFGQDVNIPSLTVTYNLQSPGAVSTEGRDQTYVLPALPMRVLSIVPRERGRHPRRVRTDVCERRIAARPRDGRDCRRLNRVCVCGACSRLSRSCSWPAGSVRTIRRSSSAADSQPYCVGRCTAESGEAVPPRARGWTPALDGPGGGCPADRRRSARWAGRWRSSMSRTARPNVSGSSRCAPGSCGASACSCRRRQLPPSLLAAIENRQRRVPRATVQPIMDALQQFSVAVYGRAGEADAIALNNAVDEARRGRPAPVDKVAEPIQHRTSSGCDDAEGARRFGSVRTGY